MARMWVRGGRVRHDSPDGRSIRLVAPYAGRGLKARVLSLVSCYGPVSRLTPVFVGVRFGNCYLHGFANCPR